MKAANVVVTNVVGGVGRPADSGCRVRNYAMSGTDQITVDSSENASVPAPSALTVDAAKG
jgi:hypothetical protein